MPSLADAILSAADIDDEIADVEDEELAREMEKLNELREALTSAKGSRPSSGAVHSRIASDSLASAASDPTPAISSEGRAHSRGAPKSLADQINGTDEIEHEFEAMEEELQQQLMKYKAQCEGAEGSKAPITEVAEAPTTEATTQNVLSTTARSLPEASATARSSSSTTFASSKEPSSASPPDTEGLPAEIITPELLELRSEAARMEEAFPAIESNSEETQVPRRRQRQIRTRDNRKAEIPEDPEIVDLTKLLGSLDSRLGSIQQKHDSCDVIERESGYTSGVTSSSVSKVISDMRAQNAHLRERFQASSKRGVLGLDASIFGASDSHPRVQMQA